MCQKTPRLTFFIHRIGRYLIVDGGNPKRSSDVVRPLAESAVRSDRRSRRQLVLCLLRHFVDDHLEHSKTVIQWGREREV
jgi:hypothetical protein